MSSLTFSVMDPMNSDKVALIEEKYTQMEMIG